jgi:solute carrier family 35 (UDP-xylose/UDP-N-acetylglucosamine transporter), member B4
MEEKYVLMLKILFFCCLNIYFLELMVSYDPKCGGLITIMQFLYTTSEGLINNIEFKDGMKFKKRNKPFLFQLLIVIFYFSSTILGNLATSFNISLALLNVFRSASLACNMIIGMLFFGTK